MKKRQVRSPRTPSGPFAYLYQIQEKNRQPTRMDVTTMRPGTDEDDEDDEDEIDEPLLPQPADVAGQPNIAAAQVVGSGKRCRDCRGPMEVYDRSPDGFDMYRCVNDACWLSK